MKTIITLTYFYVPRLFSQTTLSGKVVDEGKPVQCKCFIEGTYDGASVLKRL
jgi:hypothetical protein